MSAPAQPGWYPDPDRDPRLQRWWTGQSWSEVTQTAPGATLTAPRLRPDTIVGASPRRLPWFALAGALALIVVLVVAWSLRAGTNTVPGTDPVAGPTSAGTTFPPGTVRIIDPDAGISYVYLGEGWREWDFTNTHQEMQVVHGQYIITQNVLPDSEGEFIAECSSGPLGTQFPASSTADYPSAVEEVTNSFRANYYPAPNDRRDISSAPVTVAGQPGYLLKFDLQWDIPGYDSTGERVAVLLLDVGKAVPAVLYISIPNTHAELYGIIDSVIASVQLA